MKHGMNRATMIVGFALIGVIAMPAGAADCNQGGNLLSNCDFTTDLTNWSRGYGDWWGHEPVDGATAPGCVHVNAQTDGSNYFASARHDCVPLSAGVTYQAGFSVRTETGPSGGTCRVHMMFFSGANCDTFLGRFYSPSLEVYSTWSDIFESIDSPASTESATITLDCRHSSDFEIRFDDALLGIDLVPVELMSFSVE